MRQRRHNRTAGFSLIEVVVGIALLGLVSAPICASLVLSVRLNTHARMLMDARLQASGTVETLLAEGIDVDATVNGAAVWAQDDENRCWTRDMDGVTVTVAEVPGAGETTEPYYEVTVSSTVGTDGEQESVELTTQIRTVRKSSSTDEDEENADSEAPEEAGEGGETP